MTGEQLSFDQADWWDEEKIREFCDSYPCGFCDNVGAQFQFPGSEGMFDVVCRECGALVGRMPPPDAEFMRQIMVSLGGVVEQEPYGPVELGTWVCDEQYAWIREHYGDDADHANYGWSSDLSEEPRLVCMATKVYGHGVLSTVAQVGAAFEVTHEFTPFGSEADIVSKRRAIELMRQRFEDGFFDEDPPGAPPGAKQRVREWLEDREQEHGEPPAA